jgi:hypothetical protein
VEITRKYYAKKKNKRKEKKITLHHQYENEEQQPTAGRAYGSIHYMLLLLLELTWSFQALWCLLKMTAAPKLRAGLIPVPVMGIVAKCTK